MGVLDVPGARLYFETHGGGPLMVMVPGANGTADSFNRVTDHLAAHYTVVTYDRRGFSRSRPDCRRQRQSLWHDSSWRRVE